MMARRWKTLPMVAVSASAVADVDNGSLDVPEFALLLAMPGRHGVGQIDALFEKSGLFTTDATLKHHPFLAFVYDPEKKRLAVQIVTCAGDLLGFAPETPVMAQWPGQWRSDWFHFTVSDYLDYRRRQEGGY